MLRRLLEIGAPLRLGAKGMIALMDSTNGKRTQRDFWDVSGVQGMEFGEEFGFPWNTIAFLRKIFVFQEKQVFS